MTYIVTRVDAEELSKSNAVTEAVFWSTQLELALLRLGEDEWEWRIKAEFVGTAYDLEISFDGGAMIRGELRFYWREDHRVHVVEQPKALVKVGIVDCPPRKEEKSWKRKKQTITFLEKKKTLHFANFFQVRDSIKTFSSSFLLVSALSFTRFARASSCFAFTRTSSNATAHRLRPRWWAFRRTSERRVCRITCQQWRDDDDGIVPCSLLVAHSPPLQFVSQITWVPFFSSSDTSTHSPDQVPSSPVWPNWIKRKGQSSTIRHDTHTHTWYLKMWSTTCAGEPNRLSLWPRERRMRPNSWDTARVSFTDTTPSQSKSMTRNAT